MRIFECVIISFIISSCTKYPEDVATALTLADKNGKTLKEVLDIYNKEDKRKYEAACFLITNMPYHNADADVIIPDEYCSFFKEENNEYQSWLKKMNIEDIPKNMIIGYDSIRNKYAESFKSLPSPSIGKYCNDIHTISGQSLKKHIDACFKEWDKNPLLRNLSFDDFKEFILPYRTANEQLTLSREQMKQLFGEKFAATNIYSSIERFKIYVEKMRWLNNHVKNNTHLGVYDLLLPKFTKDCFNITTWTCNIFRTSGIPVTLEYTPQYRDRNRKHFWCASPDSNGITVPYTVPDNNLMEDWSTALRYAGKVYRLSFGVNKKSPSYTITEEFIPKSLNSVLIHDVTWRYHQTVTLKITSENKKPILNHIAYLCFWNGDYLEPVGWGRVQNNIAIFEHVPINTVFIPIYYNNETPHLLNKPFVILGDEQSIDIPRPFTRKEKYKEYVIDSNNQWKRGLFYNSIEPDKFNKRINMILFRKYPEKREMQNLQNKMIGGCIVASNNASGPFDTLYTLKDKPFPYLQNLKLNNKKKYRYYKYESSSQYRHANIAHIEFLREFSAQHTCMHPTKLPIFPEDKSTKDDGLFKIVGKVLNSWSKPENAFDGNWDTYVPAAFVGMDFGQPVHISHINLLPRNANNMIVIGDTYQLFYYDNGWVIFDTIVAEKNFLSFENVPSNTLYWLRNISHGEEELPFFYDDNVGQIFIHEIDKYYKYIIDSKLKPSSPLQLRTSRVSFRSN